MLLTTCPNCSAQFKVQPEQLNVRQGRVMCGRCRGVFNAFQSLVRVTDEDVPSTEVVAAADTAAAHEPLPGLTDALFLREEPLPLSQDFTQTDFPSDVRPVDIPVELPAEFPTGTGFNDALPVEKQHVSESMPSGSLLADADENETAPTAENPLLAPVMGHRQSDAAPRARAWTLAAVFLALALAAQAAYAFRSTIIHAFPQVRPLYVSVCDWAGCRLTWGRDDNAIRIEASDLIELPGKSGRIQLTATLVNRGTAPQDLPALELKLTDNANQVILSRVMTPEEYLGRIPSRDENLAPNIEMYVNLSFELTPRAQASGYGVRAFYF